MDIKESDVHRAFYEKPELFENGLGIKIKPDSIIHHFLLSDKGEHIDFVFQDVQDRYYIAEVKLREKPINVIPQLMEHEYKKFVARNPDIHKDKIVPVIVVDKEATTDQDGEILHKMSISLCTYDLKEIESVLSDLKDKMPTPPPLEIPDTTDAQKLLDAVDALKESYGDINYLLEGFKGEEYWDGYYDFRLFWLWKDDMIPETHKRVFRMLFERRYEDCIWYTFITAAADSEDTAASVFDKGYIWDRVLKSYEDDEARREFEDFLCKQKFKIQALKAHGNRKQVFRDYIGMVSPSQLDFFMGKIKEVDNPFDAYDRVYKTLRKIKNVGNVVAGAFATFLSQWRILPIIPTENVRRSKFVKKALEHLGIKSKYEKELLRLAKKYSVLPIVFERVMHKLGRRTGKKTDSDEE